MSIAEKTKNGLVSVIIPAYNAEKYVERAVMSVLNQTYDNIEVLVINDGSTDKTEEIVLSLQQKNSTIRLISVENGGVSRARNIGIENSKGEYVAFLDADDEFFPEAIEVMLYCLIKNNADIVSAKSTLVENGSMAEYEDTGEDIIYSGEDALIHSIDDYPETYTVWGKLYNKKSILNVKFCEGKKVHEDSFFVFQCLVKGIVFAVLDKTLYKYYVVNSSASRCEFSEKFFDIVYFANEKKRIIDEKFPEYSEKGKNILIKAYMALLKNLCKTDNKYKDYEKNCIKYIKENKTYFVPAIGFDRKWLFIIDNNLYPIYKFLYRIYFKLKNYRRK